MDQPRIQTLADWTRLILLGLCMGVADIIPGISGGTIAFILGFYEDLLNSIKSLNKNSLKILFKGHVREFFRLVAWKFILGLVAGIVIAMATFSHAIRYILGHEDYRAMLYATFFGLIVAAAILCSQQLKRWKISYFLVFLLTTLMAFCLTGSTFKIENSTNLYSIQYFDPWIIFCGAIAICAMILPGISGSYLLTILGMYTVVVGALADFTFSLAHGSFDATAFFILANMLLGIMLGALFFTRFVSWILNKYHDLSIAALTGFMVGALHSVWPFWTYEVLDKGPQLQPLEAFLPSLADPFTWLAIGLAIVGAMTVFLLHFVAKKNTAEDKESLA